MKSLRWSASVVGLVMFGIGFGTSAGAATFGPHAYNPHSIFNGSNLVPGNTRTGQLTMPGGSQNLRPYVKVLNLKDGCLKIHVCAPSGPLFSQSLELVLTAPDGETLEGTPAELTTATRLPGGPMGADARFAISMTLPSSATNSSQGRTIGFDLQWGGLNSTGAPITSVLGETFTKGDGTLGTPTNAVPGKTFTQGVLPLTGSPTSVEVLVGILLMAGGGLILIVGSWRRRTQGG